MPPSTLLKAILKPAELRLGKLDRSLQVERPCAIRKSPFKAFRTLESSSFSSLEDASKHLKIKGWILREVLWAFENDAEAKQVSQGARAVGFEDAVAKLCSSAGVALEREADLRKRGMVTPDVLFSSPVTIRSAQGAEDYRWLECKNFHGGGKLGPMMKKLAKQASKYKEVLGPGAIVFAAGASEELRRRLKDLGVGVLDGSNVETEKEFSGPAKFVSGPSAGFWSLDYEALFERKYRKSKRVLKPKGKRTAGNGAA